MERIVTNKNVSYNREVMRVFAKASWNYPVHAIISLLTPLSAVLMNVGVPYFAGRALASILTHNGQFKTNMIYIAIIAVLGIIANRIGVATMWTLEARAMADLHEQNFRHLINRGISFHTNHIGGKLVSDAIDCTTAYATLISAVYNNGISLLAVLIAGLIVVTVNSWQLGVFVIITVVVILFWTYLNSLERHKLRMVRLRATQNLTSHLSDSIVNAPTVKTFAAEKYEIAENNRLNKVLADLRVRDWHKSSYSANNRVALLMILIIGLLLLINHLSLSEPDILATGIFAFTYTFTLLLRLFDLNTLTRQVEETFLQATPMGWSSICCSPTRLKTNLEQVHWESRTAR